MRSLPCGACCLQPNHAIMKTITCITPGIARQRGLLGPGTSTGPCLATSNHDIPMILSCDETCPPVDLRIRDVGSPELLAEPCLISLVGSLATSLQTNGWTLSTSCLKHPLAINNSGLRGGCLPPVPLLLYELSFTNGSRVALRVIAKYHCASARTFGPWNVHGALSNGL